MPLQCPLILITMSTSTSNVLKELTQFKQEYRDQYFQFTEGQRVRYNELLNSRREIVKNWHKSGQVSTSSKPVVKEVK